jgi:hypothetical protein
LDKKDEKESLLKIGRLNKEVGSALTCVSVPSNFLFGGNSNFCLQVGKNYAMDMLFGKYFIGFFWSA